MRTLHLNEVIAVCGGSIFEGNTTFEEDVFVICFYGGMPIGGIAGAIGGFMCQPNIGIIGGKISTAICSTAVGAAFGTCLGPILGLGIIMPTILLGKNIYEAIAG